MYGFFKNTGIFSILLEWYYVCIAIEGVAKNNMIVVVSISCCMDSLKMVYIAKYSMSLLVNTINCVLLQMGCSSKFFNHDLDNLMIMICFYFYFPTV